MPHARAPREDGGARLEGRARSNQRQHQQWQVFSVQSVSFTCAGNNSQNMEMRASAGDGWKGSREMIVAGDVSKVSGTAEYVYMKLYIKLYIKINKTNRPSPGKWVKKDKLSHSSIES